MTRAFRWPGWTTASALLLALTSLAAATRPSAGAQDSPPHLAVVQATLEDPAPYYTNSTLSLKVALFTDNNMPIAVGDYRRYQFRLDSSNQAAVLPKQATTSSDGRLVTQTTGTAGTSDLTVSARPANAMGPDGWISANSGVSVTTAANMDPLVTRVTITQVEPPKQVFLGDELKFKVQAFTGAPPMLVEIPPASLSHYRVEFEATQSGTPSRLKLPDPAALGGDAYRVQAKFSGEVQLTAKVRRGDKFGGLVDEPRSADQSIPLTILGDRPKALRLIDAMVSPSTSIVAGQPFQIRVLLRDSDGNLIITSDYSKRFEISAESQSTNVSQLYRENESGAVWNGTLKSPGPALITITARPKDGGSDRQVSVALNAVTIADIRPAVVTADIMDSKTVNRLFGKKFKDNYHVMTVTVKNNLPKNTGDALAGASIMVYRSSLDFGVTFEKRWNPAQHSSREKSGDDSTNREPGGSSPSGDGSSAPENRANRKEWSEVTQADVIQELELPYLGEDTVDGQSRAVASRSPAGGSGNPLRATAFADPNGGAQNQRAVEDGVTWASLSDLAHHPGFQPSAVDQLLLADLASRAREIAKLSPGIESDQMTGQIRDLLRFVRTPGEPATKGAREALIEELDAWVRAAHPRYIRHRFRYRPYTNEMMAAIALRQEQHNARAWFLRGLNFLGTVATAVTRIPNLTGGDANSNRIGSILNLFGSVFTPAVAEFWPNMHETHRINLMAMSMREVEEVPFGSQLTRVVFVPKREMVGMLRGHLVRIAEVHRNFIGIRVSVIQPNQTGDVNDVPNRFPGNGSSQR